MRLLQHQQQSTATTIRLGPYGSHALSVAGTDPARSAACTIQCHSAHTRTYAHWCCARVRRGGPPARACNVASERLQKFVRSASWVGCNGARMTAYICSHALIHACARQGSIVSVHCARARRTGFVCVCVCTLIETTITHKNMHDPAREIPSTECLLCSRCCCCRRQPCHPSHFSTCTRAPRKVGVHMRMCACMLAGVRMRPRVVCDTHAH